MDELSRRLSTKLLAHAVERLGVAMSESLCTHPDRALVHRLVEQAQDYLAEYQDAIADETAGETASEAASETATETADTPGRSGASE